MKNNENGFTLIEMLIVLFVIGIILAIALPNLTKTGSVAEDKAEEANIRMLEAQAENYRLERGNYPSNVSDLVNGGYIKSAPKCQDGSDFNFNTSGGTFSVSCG